MNDSTQRPSPSSPQCEAEPCLEAGEGLDGTACSASPDFGVLNAEKTMDAYQGILKLRMVWNLKARIMREMGKSINNYGRCWAAADAYEICSKELGSIFSVIETLQYDKQVPINK